MYRLATGLSTYCLPTGLPLHWSHTFFCSALLLCRVTSPASLGLPFIHHQTTKTPMKTLLLSMIALLFVAKVNSQSLFIPGGTTGISTSSTAGNVGVGLANPASKLHLKGGAFTVEHTGLLGKFVSSTSSAYLSLDPAGTRSTFFGHTTDETDYTYIDNNFQAGVEFALTKFGFLGLGTTTPEKKLHIVTPQNGIAVFESTNTNAFISLENGSGGTGGIGRVTDPVDGNYMWITSNTSGATSFQPEFIIRGGNIGMGTFNPSHKLSVNGTIRAKEIIVNTGWADYVFADSYRLKPLAEVERFIQTHNHLPGVPSANQVQAEGIGMGEASTLLLEKVEELTLYLIELDKKVKQLQEENNQLKKKHSGQ